MAKQIQKMKLQMKLSPQQMMLMRLLQMPVHALDQAIREEVEKNPLLEVEGGLQESAGMSESLSAGEGDDEMAQYFGDDDGYFGGGSGDYVEPGLRADSTMTDLLMEQLSMKELTDRERVILDQLVGSLDDAGYLSRDLDMIENELAFRQGVECREGEMEHALRVLQSLDPAGVGARSLQECMLLQLNRQKPRTFATRCAIEIVENYFDLLGRQAYAAIRARLDIGDADMEEAVACIRRLNPKPCSVEEEADRPAPTVIPDFVVGISDGHLTCSYNRQYSPRLKMSTYYAQTLGELENKKQPTAADKAAADFLKEKSAQAEEFISSVEQRKVVLTSTMNLLAKIQRKYLASGDPADLKPLTQKEVSEMLGIDETVMSRIVNQKYVQTDFGTVLLKDFFVHTTTSNAEGEEVTTEEVKRQLRQIVDAEDKSAPLTDVQIQAMLRERGLDLARRTIAKYREMAGIPAARLRRAVKMVIVVLMMFAGSLAAQTPMTYYDSLLMMQQQPQRTTPKTAKKSDLGPNGKATIRQTSEKIDTARLRGDDLIDKIYDSERPLPSSMWYGNKFSSSRVRLESYTIDSLPDEVNLKLLKGDEQFCFPVKNVRTSPYGWRWERPHRGVDIALNTGDEVHCAFDGVVRIAKPMGAYGNLVVVRHFNGLETVYGHLSKIKVKPMQEVKAGAVLGLGGSTGRSTGPHLHFEVRFQYEPFDPEWILDFSNYTLRTKKLHLDKTYFGISKPRGRQVLAYKADKSFVKEEAANKVKPKPLYYTVKKGDRMADIESLYKTTAEKIKELNPDFEKLRPGLKLRVR